MDERHQSGPDGGAGDPAAAREASRGSTSPSPSLSPAKRALLRRRMAERGLPGGAKIPAADRTKPLALSFSQERMWLLNQMLPESGPAYHVPRLIRLKGPLDVTALEGALNSIVDRHEILRTTYRAAEGSPVQVVHPGGTFWIRLEVEDAPGDAAGRIQELIRQPFDLEHGPMLRAALLRFAPEEHLLALVTHHIATDDQSRAVLTRELGASYSALARGGDDPLPALPVQYSDYAAWQREAFSGSAGREKLGWWKQTLAGLPEALNLPTDFARPATPGFRGDRLIRPVPPELSRDFAALARKHGATAFHAYAATVSALLSRHAGQDDFALGVPVANRDAVETEALIGCFSNTIALRVDVSGNPSFLELLGRTRSRALDAMERADVPFEAVAAELGAGRNLNQSPLFQVLFIHQTDSGAAPAMAGLEASIEDAKPGTAKFDLQIAVVESGDGGVRMLWDYNAALFAAETIERWQRHLMRLIESILKEPGRDVTALEILPPAELALAVERWNRTETEYPRQACLHDMVRRQADASPSHVAVAAGAAAMTYRELDERSDTLARHLRARGVAPGTAIGVLMDRTIELPVALLGILKAGGAYVPLDTHQPAERLGGMLEEIGAPLVLTDAATLPSVPASAAKPLAIDMEWPAIAATPAEISLDCGVTPEDLAYIIFTSGSTGKPKGVMIPHRAVVNFLSSMAQAPGFSETDTLLAVTTMSFDIAGLEIFLPLTTGGRVHIASRETAADGGQLAALIESAGATVMQATPATWRMLIDCGWQGRAQLRALCGGEALDRGLAGQILDRCGELWNMYGPTETTIWSSISKIEKDAPITLGQPIANTQMYVLDRHGRPCPLGVAGELTIGGDGVAQGYWKRPELTAERFLANSFLSAGAGGARMYRTGDLARRTASGEIEYLGRLDHQVKIRGFRIELGEIEAALDAHPAVSKSVVVAREDRPGEKRLVAYIQAAPGGQPGTAELLAAAKAKLPEYMIPSAFVALEEFPLNGSGKIDRLRLPAPPQDRSAMGRPYEAPRTPVEQAVAEVWRDAFHLDRVGVHDNFFELGGNSLIAARLCWRIGRQLDVTVPVRWTFEYPVVEDFARAVTLEMARRTAPDLEALLAEMEGLEAK